MSAAAAQTHNSRPCCWVFHRKQGRGHPDLSRVQSPPAGRLWGGTIDGLDHFDGDAWTTKYISAAVRAILPLAASINTPSEGQEFIQGQPIRLAGAGYDLEDGPLSGSALSRSSDRDGALGRGSVLSATLTVGVQVITLEATDSDGQTVDGSVSVEVGYDFDGDGLSDEYEASQGILEWWNPEDAGADSDDDGLTNRSEAAWATDPADPDSDGDGIPDGEEVAGDSSPNDAESQPLPPMLLASATELSFASSANGPSPASQEVLLISSTPQELSWTAQADVPWLSLQPISGTTAAVVAV